MRPSLHVALCLAVLCVAAVSSVTGATVASPSWLISTDDAGCTELLNADPAALGAPLAVGATCPTYTYADVPSPPGGPTGIATSLAAVDTEDEVVHLCEEELDGRYTISSSPLSDRASSVRHTLAAGVTVAAMALGLPSTSAGVSTPVLMMTSRPDMGLSSYSPDTGALTTLLSPAALRTAANMSAMVSGVLVRVETEVYWVGLSGAENDETKLHLYSYNLLDATLLDLPLQGLTDLLSLHSAPELQALLFVSSETVGAAVLPASGGLTASGLSALNVAPIAVVSGSATLAGELRYSAQIADFFAVYSSSRWLPRVSQLVLGAQLATPGGFALVLIDMGLSAGGAVQAEAVAQSSVAEMPLMLQSSVAPFTLTNSILPSTVQVAAASATPVRLTGYGLSQAFIRSSFLCTFQAADANDAPIGASLSVVGVLDLTTLPGAAEQVICTLPETYLAASTIYAASRRVLLTLSALQGLANDGSQFSLDVDECLTNNGGCSGTCVNTLSGSNCGGCAAGSTEGSAVNSCAPCALGTYKSTTDSVACTACPTGTTTLAEGATTSAACLASNPCDAELRSHGHGGADTSVSMTVRLTGSPYADFGSAQGPKALQFRRDVAQALNVSLSRIGDIYSIAQDVDASGLVVPANTILSFTIQAPSASERGQCMVQMHAGGAAAVNVGQSAASLAASLTAQLSDPNSVLFTQTPSGSQLSGGNGLIGSSNVVLPVAPGQTMAECAASALLPLVLLVVSVLATMGWYVAGPCRSPFARGATVLSLRARPGEIFPSVLPLVALGFDAYFLALVMSIASGGAIIVAVGAAIIIVGAVHAYLTIAPSWKAQKRALVSPAGSAARLPAGALAAEEPTFASWLALHSRGSKALLGLSLLNFHVLGLLSASLNPRTTLWDCPWNAKAKGSLRFNALMQRGSARHTAIRIAPMLLLQAAVIYKLECNVVGLAPIIANVLALVASIARLVATRNLPEPGPATKRAYTVNRGKGALKEGGWMGDEASQSGVERSRSASSASTSAARAGRPPVAGAVGSFGALPGAGRGAAPKHMLGAAANEFSDEEENAELHAAAINPGRDGLQSSAAPSNALGPDGKPLPGLPMYAGEEGAIIDNSFEDMDIQPEDEAAGLAAGLRVSEWKLLEGTMRRVTRADAGKIVALREYSAGVKAAALAERHAQAAAAAAEIEAPVQAGPVSISHVWVLVDALQGEPELGPGDELKAVEQFDAAGQPFAPAMFKRFVKRAEVVEAKKAAVIAERQAAARAAAEEVEREMAAAAAAAAAAEAAEAEAAAASPDAPEPTEAALKAAAVVHQWQFFDSSEEPVLEAGDEVRRVEQFDAQGLPFMPAMHKRYVKKLTKKARAALAKLEADKEAAIKLALQKQAEEAAAKAAEAAAAAALIAAAEAEKAAAEQRAEEERVAAEQAAEAERLAAEQKAEEERLAAERAAEEARQAAARKAEEQRLAEVQRQKDLAAAEAARVRAAAEARAAVNAAFEAEAAAEAQALAELEAAAAFAEAEAARAEAEAEAAWQAEQDAADAAVAAAAQAEADAAAAAAQAEADAAAADRAAAEAFAASFAADAAATAAAADADADADEGAFVVVDPMLSASPRSDEDHYVIAPMEASSRNVVDFGPETGIARMLTVDGRAALQTTQEAAAMRAAVQVSKVEGGEVVAQRSKAAREDAEDAEVIGNLGSVGLGARPAPVAGRRMKSLLSDPASPSIAPLSPTRLAGGGAFSFQTSPSLQSQQSGLAAELARAAAKAWTRADEDSTVGAGAQASSAFALSDDDSHDLESAPERPMPVAGRRAGANWQAARGAAAAANPTAPRSVASAAQLLAAQRVATRPLVEFSSVPVSAGPVVPRTLSLAKGFGSGSSREKYTADELRMQRIKAIEDKAAAAAAEKAAAAGVPVGAGSSLTTAASPTAARTLPPRQRRPMVAIHAGSPSAGPAASSSSLMYSPLSSPSQSSHFEGGAAGAPSSSPPMSPLSNGASFGAGTPSPLARKPSRRMPSIDLAKQQQQ